MPSLSIDQKQQIADELRGSSGTQVCQLAEDYNCDVHDIEAAAEEIGVLECQCCNWFVDEDELADYDTPMCLECYAESNRV